MTDTVRIMPKQPIEAVPTEWANMFGGYDTMYRTKSGVGVFDDDYAEYCDGHDWVEVSEYVWDGTDEAFKAIRDALGHGQGVLEVWLCDDEYEPTIEITCRRTLNLIGVVVHQGRIQSTPGGLAPFVILPPEVTP